MPGVDRLTWELNSDLACAPSIVLLLNYHGKPLTPLFIKSATLGRGFTVTKMHIHIAPLKSHKLAVMIK